MLYVPDFSFNLISVSKLSHALNCIVTFVGSKCEIQDLKARKMIGSAELFEGLYYLLIDSRKVNSSSTQEEGTEFLPQAALWHFRLGHLSISRMQKLQEVFPFVYVDENSVCDVCQYARHKKLPYKLVLVKLLNVMSFYILIYGDQFQHLLFMAISIS